MHPCICINIEIDLFYLCSGTGPLHSWVTARALSHHIWWNQLSDHHQASISCVTLKYYSLLCAWNPRCLKHWVVVTPISELQPTPPCSLFSVVKMPHLRQSISSLISTPLSLLQASLACAWSPVSMKLPHPPVKPCLISPNLYRTWGSAPHNSLSFTYRCYPLLSVSWLWPLDCSSSEDEAVYSLVWSPHCPALCSAPSRQGGCLGQGTFYRTVWWCVNTDQWCPSLTTNHYNFMVLKIIRTRWRASSWWSLE